MIELQAKRLDDRLDVTVVDQVVLSQWNLASDDDIDAERVAVHSAALVAVRKAGQVMRRFKAERLGKSNMHETDMIGSQPRLTATGGPAAGLPTVAWELSYAARQWIPDEFVHLQLHTHRRTRRRLV